MARNRGKIHDIDRCEGILRANAAVFLYGVRIPFLVLEYLVDLQEQTRAVLGVRGTFSGTKTRLKTRIEYRINGA